MVADGIEVAVVPEDLAVADQTKVVVAPAA